MIFFHIIYKKLATIRRFFSNAKNFLLKVFFDKKNGWISVGEKITKYES